MVQMVARLGLCQLMMVIVRGTVFKHSGHLLCNMLSTNIYKYSINKATLTL